MLRLWLIRHAPALSDGRLAGRRDVAADCSDDARIAALSRRLTGLVGTDIWCSPARRCRETGAALGLSPDLRAELWEQDFGAWEDIPADQIPDLGPLSPAELARYRPPNGESFNEMCARVVPVLEAASRDTVILAHAGTTRAALSMVAGPAALSFSVHPLAVTIMARTPSGWAVEAVNCNGAG